MASPVGVVRQPLFADRQLDRVESVLRARTSAPAREHAAVSCRPARADLALRENDKSREILGLVESDASTRREVFDGATSADGKIIV